jgi:DNA-binding transcriptional ArsR family regulator
MQLGLAQPLVSKHLRVLREVGAVKVRGDGRRRFYRLNGEALKPIHDWVRTYEQTWSERFEQMDVVLAELKEQEEGRDMHIESGMEDGMQDAMSLLEGVAAELR